MTYAPRHFTPEGDPALFRCKCGRPECDAPPPADALLELLDSMRERLERPVVVNSGPRCEGHNASVGGTLDSEHLEGKGADLRCTGSRERFELIDAAIRCGATRIGIGRTFVHVGVADDKPARVAWLYR